MFLVNTFALKLSFNSTHIRDILHKYAKNGVYIKPYRYGNRDRKP